MGEEKTARTFGNETHDNCKDDARTEQNRSPRTVDDGGMDNAHQRSREKDSDRPPTREPGKE